MNQIRAILWAQFRVFRNFSPRRGRIPWALVVSVLWYGAWTFFAGLIATALAEPDIADFANAFPAALLLVFLYWQLIPLLMAAAGAALDLRKLRAYPIRDTHLFGIEVVLRATAALEMLLILCGAAAGIALNPVLPVWGALAVVPFIAFNLCVSLGVRDIVSRLLSRRRIREIVAVGFVAIWLIPQILAYRAGAAEGPRPRPRGGPGRAPEWLNDFLQGNLWPGFPWTATSNLLQSSDVLLSLPVIAAWCAAAAVFALWQFRRTLAFDPQAAGSRGSGPREGAGPLEGFYRLSGILPDPLGSLVDKELRYLARSPRFRLVFLMGCTFGIFLTRTMMRSAFGDWGPGSLAAASLYALLLLGEVCFWNSFGFDRSAAQVYFLAPVPFTRALLAKNIASSVYITIQIMIMMTVYALFRFPLTLYRVAEVFAVTAVVALFLLSIGNMISVHNPRAMNPQASMRSGAAGRTQALLLLAYPAAFAPAALAYLAAWAFDTRLAFFAVLAVVAAIGALVYKVTLEAAAERASQHRESILAALSQTDGPIAA
jgi:ABC-2 type transport system permease protein